MLPGNDRRLDTPHPATDHPNEHPGGNLQRSLRVIEVQTATPDLDAALADDGQDVNELTMPGMPWIEHFAWGTVMGFVLSVSITWNGRIKESAIGLCPALIHPRRWL
jgi:hypothetical protein